MEHRLVDARYACHTDNQSWTLCRCQVSIQRTVDQRWLFVVHQKKSGLISDRNIGIVKSFSFHQVLARLCVQIAFPGARPSFSSLTIAF